MSRTQATCLAGGIAVAAGVTGWAIGTLFAPASGTEVRRRLAWMSEQQWKSFSHGAERFLRDAAVSAAAEIARVRAHSGARAT